MELESKPQNEEKPSAASFCTLIAFIMESQDEVTGKNQESEALRKELVKVQLSVKDLESTLLRFDNLSDI